MALKEFKPNTPSLRYTVLPAFEEITRSRPLKSLLRSVRKSGGRNFQGRVTCRHRGGGHQRRYRVMDFERSKLDVPARVDSIEYDPNRNVRIALLVYRDGEKRYILAPRDLQVGMTVVSGEKVEPSVGNAMPLENVPQGIPVHNIEIQPAGGGKLCRSAGGFATIQAKEGRYVTLALPSGEVRKVFGRCRATIGQLGNTEHNSLSLGKAGRTRWLGIRPTVRGVAQNPVSHPMGGGEGRAHGGRQPCSPTGRLAKGGKTRSRRKPSQNLILRRRKP
ncbi:MAG: 50S ribosomal protein L2 [Planctomycetes bacterium]|nr:50S ribosomal protein L2 [Planctomycetota bacterium]